MKKKHEEEIEQIDFEELNKSLTDEVNVLSEKLLRSSADLQNYRKRKDEEVEKLFKYSDEDIIIEILPIIDNFERAIKLADDENNEETNKFLQGFTMIYSSLISILNKHNVREIEALDKEFDPSYHQAVLTDNVDDKDDNIVLGVLQKGYIYKDKVIRYSMVKVNKK